MNEVGYFWKNELKMIRKERGEVFGVNGLQLCPVAVLRGLSLSKGTMFLRGIRFKLLFHRLLGIGSVVARSLFSVVI